MTDLAAAWSTPDDPSSGQSLPGTTEPPPRAPNGRRQPGVVPLRPLGVGELLDGSVAVMRSCPRPVFAVSAAIAVVSGLLQLLIALTVLGPLTNSDSTTLSNSPDAMDEFLGTATIGTVLDLLVGSLGGAVLTGFVVIIVSRAVFAVPTTLREARALLRPRLVPLVLTALLVAVASSGAFLLAIALTALLVSVAGPAGGLMGALLVPGGAALAVFVYVRWSLAPAVVVLERAPVRTALARSGVLVRRSFWRVLGVLLLALVIALFVGQVVQLPLALLGSSPFSDLGSTTVDLSTKDLVLAAVFGSLSSTLVAPFTAGVQALLYVDRRMRAEGLDVVLVASAAARR